MPPGRAAATRTCKRNKKLNGENNGRSSKSKNDAKIHSDGPVSKY
jgi:hypothetical protein